ncbi:MAG: hypothetical protein EXS68_01260 [Candidatus Ryanbacteria bacterium]|nr:hypothetical protein [Candidatus Ryanbacteria bacterium]
MKTPAKEATLLTLLVLSSGLLWLSISTLLPRLLWDNMNLIWSAIAATIAFLTMWGLSVILVDKIYLMLVGWAFASYIGVIWHQTHFFIVVATALFCFGMLGMFRAKYQMERTLEGGVARSLRKCLPLTTTFLAAAIATAAFTVAPKQSLEVEALIPRWLFDPIIETLDPVIRGIDGVFDSNLLFSDYVAKKASAELGRELTANERTLATRESAKILKERIGVEPGADQKMGDIIYIVGINFMRAQAGRFQGVFPIAYAVGFFVTLRFFGILLYWIAIMIVSMVLRILRRFGIIGVRTIPANIFVYSFF